jgi:BirA family biotin operon repressor/biotin-[acetyl-CoA-carboxylase] ligase
VSAPPASRHDPRLEGTRFASVQWFASIDSTNRHLLAEAARGASDGLVAVADEQRAGRGRLGRTWVAPPGASLLVSVLLRPHLEPERLALVTIAAGIAAIDAVAELGDVHARLKWPNDVVVDDRKLAGILAERSGDAVVVGMGLNVSWETFPDEIAATATACNLCGARPVERDELLVAWLRAFDAWLDDLDRVVPAARSRSATVGRTVRIELPGETYTADAVALTDLGHLRVRRADGREETITSADVVHLRPIPPN